MFIDMEDELILDLSCFCSQLHLLNFLWYKAHLLPGGGWAEKEKMVEERRKRTDQKEKSSGEEKRERIKSWCAGGFGVLFSSL